MIKTVIVDENKDFSVALRNLIELKFNYHVISSYDSCDEFRVKYRLNPPDVVLYDITMVGGCGLDAFKETFWDNPFIKTIAITNDSGQEMLQEIIESGFKGCICKSDIYNELRTAIETVYRGDFYYPNV